MNALEFTSKNGWYRQRRSREAHPVKYCLWWWNTSHVCLILLIALPLLLLLLLLHGVCPLLLLYSHACTHKKASFIQHTTYVVRAAATTISTITTATTAFTTKNQGYAAQAKEMKEREREHNFYGKIREIQEVNDDAIFLRRINF